MKETERLLDKKNMILMLEKVVKNSIAENQISRSKLSKKKSLQEQGITLIALDYFQKQRKQRQIMKKKP